MKILFYEFNEVPWQVVDYFTKECPNSTLAEILQHAHQYTTETKDSGELHFFLSGLLRKRQKIFLLKQ